MLSICQSSHPLLFLKPCPFLAVIIRVRFAPELLTLLWIQRVLKRLELKAFAEPQVRCRQTTQRGPGAESPMVPRNYYKVELDFLGVGPATGDEVFQAHGSIDI